MEKYAVRMGGGENHRMNLKEMALIKDNHLAIIGSIRRAVEIVKAKTDKKVEVEVKSLEEVEEAVEAGPDRIMLDNMSLEEMRKAVEMIPPSIEVEASGNITLEKISQIAGIGVQYISIGALTHSAKALDMSLELELESKEG